MSSNWREYTLDELCLKITDGSHQSPKAYEGGRPMFSVKDMTEFGFSYTGVKRISEIDYLKLVKQGCRPEMNDILIAKDGSVMKHIFKVESDIEGVLLSSIAIIRPNLKKVDPDFLVWSLLNPAVKEDILNNYVSGSGVPRIVLKDFKKIVLKVPENLNDQKETVKILRSLNKKIELNTQTNQTLEQIAQAIFKSWFVDFDPVKAKIDALAEDGSADDAELAAMSVISAKTVDELNSLKANNPEAFNKLSQTATLFPAAMQDSELGEIPEGWEVNQLSDICKNHSQSYDMKSVDEVIFVNTGDVLEGDFLHKDYSPVAGLPGQAKKAIKEDDILYSEIRPKNKRFAYVDFDVSDYVVSTKFMVIQTNEKVNPRLLYMILTRQNTIDEFNVIADSRSGTFPQITFKAISNLNFCIAPREVQDAFVTQVMPMIKLQRSLKTENKQLAELRDTLLPKLLSGEIDLASEVVDSFPRSRVGMHTELTNG